MPGLGPETESPGAVPCSQCSTVGLSPAALTFRPCSACCRLWRKSFAKSLIRLMLARCAFMWRPTCAFSGLQELHTLAANCGARSCSRAQDCCARSCSPGFGESKLATCRQTVLLGAGRAVTCDKTSCCVKRKPRALCSPDACCGPPWQAAT